MKYSLSITDASASELAHILAIIGGGSGVTVQQTVTQAAATPVNSDDDTTGDVAAQPGSLDKNGLPWDDRIHSTPATLTTKGVWRARRGVADALVASVEAELRARQSQPVAAPVQPTYQAPAQQQPAAPVPQYQPQPPVIEHQPAAPVYQTPAPVQQQPAPPQYVAPAVQQPAPAPQVPQQVDFNGFMQRVQSLLQQQLIDAGYLVNVAQRIGQAFNAPVNAITDIMGNQPMIDYAIQMMTAEGRWNWN